MNLLALIICFNLYGVLDIDSKSWKCFLNLNGVLGILKKILMMHFFVLCDSDTFIHSNLKIIYISRFFFCTIVFQILTEYIHLNTKLRAYLDAPTKL